MARIRTIKPEFWGHPVMAKLDDATKLLALALLNYADDEGYFIKNDSLIRNFARPFDLNTKKTKVSLEKLKNIGFISVSESAEHGEIGCIVKFTDHQVVNKPYPSRLKHYYSRNVHGTFTERSVLERKGMEWKGMEGNGGGKEEERNFEPPPPPPTYEEFSDFARAHKPHIQIHSTSNLMNRFKTWEAMGWIDKDGNSICKYWKAKLLATLPYIEKDDSKFQNNYPKRQKLN